MRTITDIKNYSRGYVVRNIDIDAKKWKNQIAWLSEKDGWYAPRRFHIVEYSKDVYRFKEYGGYDFPPSVWKRRISHIPQFEVTVHISEIDERFLERLTSFVEWYSNGQDDEFEWPGLSEQSSFPSYSFSKKAEEVCEANRAKGIH